MLRRDGAREPGERRRANDRRGRKPESSRKTRGNKPA